MRKTFDSDIQPLELFYAGKMPTGTEEWSENQEDAMEFISKSEANGVLGSEICRQNNEFVVTIYKEIVKFL